MSNNERLSFSFENYFNHMRSFFYYYYFHYLIFLFFMRMGCEYGLMYDPGQPRDPYHSLLYCLINSAWESIEWVCFTAIHINKT